MKPLEKIMLLTGATSDAELASKLGYKSQGTITNWKARGEVPMKVLRQVAGQYGRPIEWFMQDEEKNPLDDELQRVVDMYTHDIVAAAKAANKELELLEDFMALRREWRKKAAP